MNKRGDSKKQDYFFKLVKSRKTTYDFSNKKVEDEDLKKILEAARWAPSCSNLQPWRFVVIKNQNTIKQLVGVRVYCSLHNCTFCKSHLNKIPTVVVALLLDLKKWASNEKCIPKEKIGVYEAFMCLAMPASIMLFEALELGVDSYLITPDYKKASEVLKLKKDYMCPLLVGFGYEQKGASQKKKERRELKELVFYEKL